VRYPSNFLSDSCSTAAQTIVHNPDIRVIDTAHLDPSEGSKISTVFSSQVPYLMPLSHNASITGAALLRPAP
jgi:hypothetical protein